MYNICMENIHCLNNACVLLFNKLNTETRNLSLGSLDTAEFDSADPPSYFILKTLKLGIRVKVITG